VHHEHRLLLSIFRVHEAHIRARHRLANSFRVIRIVLIALHIGFYELWRDELDRVAERFQASSKVVGSAARFHADQTG
jgi:hypothetical protein